MRSKEEAHDYRYFAEPDLLPLHVEAKWIDEVGSRLPELPAARRQRFVREWGLKDQSAKVLTASRPLADYFEATAAAAGDGQAAANWIETEILRKIREDKIELREPADIPLAPERLGKIVVMVRDGTISGKIAKDLFEMIYATGKDPAEVVRQQGLAQVTDTGPIRQAIDKVVAENPDQLARYRAGKTALLGFFVGQVLKATGGKANPELVNRLLKERLDKP